MANYTRYYTDYIPRHLGFIKWLKFNSLLDLGCGDGAMLYALRKLFKNKYIAAVDILPERVVKLNKINLPIDGFVGDATRLDMFKCQVFDVIICHQVIEHVKDDAALILEAYRVLKPKGYMYLSTVFKKKWAWFYHRCNGKWTLDPTHLREYSDDNLVKEIEKSFFIVINEKSLMWWSITDFILKRIGLQDFVYEKHPWLNWLRRFKLPIPGYYIWELVLYSEGKK